MTDRLRIGDVRGLIVEITPRAVESYRLGLARLQRRVTENAARAELAEQLAGAAITWDWDRDRGRPVRVRRRDTQRELDVEADLILVSPAHVRCTSARARHDPRLTRNADNEHRVYAHDRKLGYLRVVDDKALEYRPVAEESGAAPPPWGPVPEHVRAALRQVPRNIATLKWLASRGITFVP